MLDIPDVQRQFLAQYFHNKINGERDGPYKSRSIRSFDTLLQSFKDIPFCDARLYRFVNTIIWPLLYPRIQDNWILEKSGSCNLGDGSYMVPETIQIRLCKGVIDTCNGHNGNLEVSLNARFN